VSATAGVETHVGAEVDERVGPPGQAPTPASTRGRRRRSRFDWRVWLIRLIPVVALVVFWIVEGQNTGIKGQIFPSPGEILSAMWTMLKDGTYVHHLWATTQELLLAFVIGVGAGLILGLLVGSTRTGQLVFEPLFMLLYALPRIALFPIFLTIFGIGMESKIALGAINGFFPVFVNTLAGMKGLSRLHLDVARSLQASRGQRYRKVVLPSIFGPVVTGIRLGVTLSIIGVLVGEIIQSSQGLGFYIFDRYSFLDFPAMYGAIILTLILVLFINIALDAVERRALRWRN
jgi:NitT/TauT family transport system permease protein